MEYQQHYPSPDPVGICRQMCNSAIEREDIVVQQLAHFALRHTSRFLVKNHMTYELLQSQAQ